MDTSPTITGATLTTAALNGTLGATTPSTVAATSVNASLASTFKNTFTNWATNSSAYTTGNIVLRDATGNNPVGLLTTGGVLYLGKDTVTDFANFSSTGLAVTGNLSATGTLTGVTDLTATGTILAGPTTGAASVKHRFSAGGAGSICAVQSNVIGAVAATSAFTVGQNPSAALGITYDRGSDRRYILSDGSPIYIGTASTAAPATGFAFTEQGRFTTNGLMVTNTVGVGGTTPSASGAGITFPATQSASTDANTLDDYEEGTWTPTIQGGTTAGTYTYEAARTGGKYTKVGNVVTVWASFRIGIITTAGTGALKIGGLPFSSGSRTASSWDNSDSLMVNLYASGVNVSAATYPPPLMGALSDGVTSFDVFSYGKNYAVATVIGDLSGADWIYTISGSYTTT
jgi:hypothetical protein